MADGGNADGMAAGSRHRGTHVVPAVGVPLVAIAAGANAAATVWLVGTAAAAMAAAPMGAGAVPAGPVAGGHAASDAGRGVPIGAVALPWRTASMSSALG